jgi:hypothetical protein
MAAHALQPGLRSIQDAAAAAARLGGAGTGAHPRDAAALRRVYGFTDGAAACTVGPQLAAKYGLEQDNRQRVICVTNRCGLARGGL